MRFRSRRHGHPQRIEIVLADDEHPHGALYIANDGQPFTPSNFKALSNLGQSDRILRNLSETRDWFSQCSQNNQGAGIYSRNERESSSFDGYCFSFQPDVIQMFEGPIRRVVDGDNSVESPEAIGAGSWRG